MSFEKEGPENTQATIDIALRAARDRKIRHLVVATSTGATAKLLVGQKDVEVVAVTLSYGFPKPGESALSDATRAELTKAGVRVLTTGHALGGVERGLSSKFNGVYPVEIIAHSLRLFGHGTKVAVEVAVMALDAGLIPYREPVIAIGGTKSGADTALVVVPSYSSSIFESRVREVLAKPF